jgi:hypothetical protein
LQANEIELQDYIAYFRYIRNHTGEFIEDVELSIVQKAMQVLVLRQEFFCVGLNNKSDCADITKESWRYVQVR